MYMHYGAGAQTRAQCMIGKHYITELHSQPLDMLFLF